MTNAAQSSPLWIQLLVASVPILGAVVTGIFLLSTTLTRKVERLKNLVEIHKDYPSNINPEATLERVMLRQLQAIEFATTPFSRLERKLFALMAVALLTSSVLLLIGFLFPNLLSELRMLILALIFAIIGAAAAIATLVMLIRKEKSARRKYETVLISL